MNFVSHELIELTIDTFYFDVWKEQLIQVWVTGSIFAIIFAILIVYIGIGYLYHRNRRQNWQETGTAAGLEVVHDTEGYGPTLVDTIAGRDVRVELKKPGNRFLNQRVTTIVYAQIDVPSTEGVVLKGTTSKFSTSLHYLSGTSIEGTEVFTTSESVAQDLVRSIDQEILSESVYEGGIYVGDPIDAMVTTVEKTMDDPPIQTIKQVGKSLPDETSSVVVKHHGYITDRDKLEQHLELVTTVADAYESIW